MAKQEGKEHKLKDVQSIDFGTEVLEIISSMEILLAQMAVNEDADIQQACHVRMEEGFVLLKEAVARPGGGLQGG